MDMEINHGLTRRSAPKRMAKLAASVIGMSVLPIGNTDAQYYYKYYNYYNSGYGNGNYTK